MIERRSVGAVTVARGARRAGAGRYSSMTLLMIAIGRPGRGEVVGAVGADHRQLLAENADRLLGRGDRHRDRLGAGRRHRLDAARARAAGDAIDQVGRRPELVLHDGAREQGVVRRQHADRRRVVPVGAIGLDQLLGIGVPVVQVERERDRARVRRQLDDDAFGRCRGRSARRRTSASSGRPRRAATGSRTSPAPCASPARLRARASRRAPACPGALGIGNAARRGRSAAASSANRMRMSIVDAGQPRAGGHPLRQRRCGAGSARGTPCACARCRGRRRASRSSRRTSSASRRRASTCTGACPRTPPPRRADRSSRGSSGRSGWSSAPGSAGGARTRRRAGESC